MELLNDIRQYNSLKTEEKNLLIAYLIAISSILSILDSIITKPFLLKIGLANIVSLILIYEKKYSLSFIVITSRVFIASIFTATIFSLTFLLSLSGGIFAFIFSSFSRHLFKNVSIIGISVIGSFFHIIGQGILILLIFGVTNTNILIISIFSLVALITGIITGLIGNLFYRFA